jgi:hypothetical protein
MGVRTTNHLPPTILIMPFPKQLLRLDRTAPRFSSCFVCDSHGANFSAAEVIAHCCNDGSVAREVMAAVAGWFMIPLQLKDFTCSKDEQPSTHNALFLLFVIIPPFRVIELMAVLLLCSGEHGEWRLLLCLEEEAGFLHLC